jgi:hypothetical protein
MDLALVGRPSCSAGVEDALLDEPVVVEIRLSSLFLLDLTKTLEMPVSSGIGLNNNRSVGQAKSPAWNARGKGYSTQ